MKAIEAGIINEMTKARMDELIQSRNDIQEAIRLEETATDIPEPEQVREWLQGLISGDFEDPEYMKQLIRVFVSAVYVYDDHFRLRFNYGDDTDISIPAQDVDPEVFAESKIGCTTSDPSKHFDKTALFCRAFFEVTIPFDCRAVL
jgi:hypothetical protein